MNTIDEQCVEADRLNQTLQQAANKSAYLVMTAGYWANMKTKWTATKRFEPMAARTYPQRGGIGFTFDTKAEAQAFARRENNRHNSGYIVLPVSNEYACHFNYLNAIRT